MLNLMWSVLGNPSAWNRKSADFIIVLLSLLISYPALAGDLPNHRLTPGQADPSLTKEKLCSKKFHTGSVRNVDDSLKQRVLSSYRIRDCVLHAGKKKLPLCGRLYEFDHLISIWLGGAETQKNLWPERLAGQWGARVKDKLEDHLHSLVCKGKISLKQAQHEIATDWIASYKKRMK